MKTVGVLGGMGPEATVLFMQRVLAAVPARDDADHVPLIVHQNPAVPSRIRWLIERSGENPGPVLAAMAQALVAAGAQALAMPCNTAHAYADVMRGAGVPFLDMRQASVEGLQARGVRRVGLLASPAVRLSAVFDGQFAAAGITPVFLADDAPLLALIRRVKAGETGAAAVAELERLAAPLRGQTDILLVACTELSLLTQGLAGTWIDSLDCLVQAVVEFARR